MIRFNGQRGRSQCAHSSGGRFIVRMQRSWLVMVRIIFGLRFNSRLNPSTAVKQIISTAAVGPFHRSSCSPQGPTLSFLYLTLNSAGLRVLSVVPQYCCTVACSVHLQAQYPSASSCFHHERPQKVVTEECSSSI